MFRMDSFLSTSRTIGRYYNLLSRYFLGERLDTHGKGASRGRGLLVSMGHLEKPSARAQGQQQWKSPDWKNESASAHESWRDRQRRIFPAQMFLGRYLNEQTQLNNNKKSSRRSSSEPLCASVGPFVRRWKKWADEISLQEIASNEKLAFRYGTIKTFKMKNY